MEKEWERAVNYIGQGLPEIMPVEIAGYVVDEAENPLALDNGEFTLKNISIKMWGKFVT